MSVLTWIVITVAASYLAGRAVGTWTGYQDPYGISGAMTRAYLEGLAMLILSAAALFFFGA